MQAVAQWSAIEIQPKESLSSLRGRWADMLYYYTVNICEYRALAVARSVYANAPIMDDETVLIEHA